MKVKGILGIKPIKFSMIEFIGDSSSSWITSGYFLSKQIIQNILYAGYHKARTIPEIAEQLGVEINFVADEVYFLEDNGFMDKIETDHYLTNILIHDFEKDILEKRNKIYDKYAKIVCEKYVPKLFEYILSINSLQDSDQVNIENIYIPANDLNFFMWTIITLACSEKLNVPKYNENVKKQFIKRNDGSEYFVVATLEKNQNDDDIINKHYNTTGDIWMLHYPTDDFRLISWHYNTNFDNRDIDLIYISQYLFEDLYIYIKGNIDDPDFMNKYDGLLETNFIVSKNKVETFENYLPDINEVNMIVSKISPDELLKSLPNIPDEFYDLNNELYNEIYNLCQSCYPEHLDGLVSAFYQKSLSSCEIVKRVLGYLLQHNTLKPLTDIQKKTVNMIMFMSN